MEETFVASNDVDAEMVILEIREIEAERNRLVEDCTGVIENYQAIMKREIDRAAEKIARLEFVLQRYFETVPHQATKTQETYRLPTGKLKLKLAAERMVPDNEALMNVYPAFVVQKPDFQWGELKKRLSIVDGKVIDTETGEFVEAVAVEAVPPKFIVEV